MSQTLAFAKEMRSDATDAQQRLWFYLRAHRLGSHKFKRQQPLGRYIVDFVCFEAACIVEADGGQHADNAAYDQTRDAWLRAEGFTVLRFWNNEVLTQTEAVLERIFGSKNPVARFKSGSGTRRIGTYRTEIGRAHV